MASQLYPKKLLANRYQLIELVGMGAMGQVYRAEDKLLGGLNVAVKILSRPLDDLKMIKQFQREATISALLSEQSINIVKVKDYGVDENKVPFYVMELLEGENLGDLIQFHDLSILKFLDFTRQVCSAMTSAHNGIFFEGEIRPVIHRDLKPSNIFVVEDTQGRELLKVLDFGIAELLQDKTEKVESIMGTPRYCSPEQLEGKQLDNRTDIYSLGVIMYQMLTQKMPWQPEIDTVGEWYKAHLQIMPDTFPPQLNIPLDIQKLVMRCLAKSPGDRPQSVGEIINNIDKIARILQPKLPSDRQLNLSNLSSELKLISELETFYFQQAWPQNKPQEKIVFPRLISREQEVLPSLWVMLDEDEIQDVQNNIRYNKFLFQSYPHPMILWITALYSLQDGPRWLPCYLDLKTKIGQQVTQALGDSKRYYILFFAVNKPEQCQQTISIKLMLKQRTMLKQWASVGKMLNLRSSNQAILSKKKLKQDFEALKSKIIVELQKTYTQEVHG
jgi:serine/threonine-protein kinase